MAARCYGLGMQFGSMGTELRRPRSFLNTALIRMINTTSTIAIRTYLETLISAPLCLLCENQWTFPGDSRKTQQPDCK